MANICIIPARGGSRRIPYKNIKKFHGMPIIAYSIQAARLTGLFDHIIVSTDDNRIAVTAVDYGVEVWRRSAEYYGRDYVGTQEVVKECLIGIGAKAYDAACCLYATSPLMDYKDISQGYLMLNSHTGFSSDYVISVGYPPLQDAAQFYWGMAYNFMKDVPLVSSHTRMVHIDPRRVCDINTPADWKRALKMYKELEE